MGSLKVLSLRYLVSALPILLVASGPSWTTGAAAQTSFPVAPLFHGNWCGAGDLNRASPVDAFDAACRAHDLCYERLGRGACSCDRAFLQATAVLVKSPRTQETVRSKAATANSLFSATLCTESPRSRQASRKR